MSTRPERALECSNGGVARRRTPPAEKDAMRFHIFSQYAFLSLVLAPIGCTTLPTNNLNLPAMPEKKDMSLVTEAEVQPPVPAVMARWTPTPTKETAPTILCENGVCRVVPKAPGTGPAKKTWGGEDPAQPRFLPERLDTPAPAAITPVSLEVRKSLVETPAVRLGTPEAIR
jgi:hypothetical protein